MSWLKYKLLLTLHALCEVMLSVFIKKCVEKHPKSYYSHFLFSDVEGVFSLGCCQKV